MTKRELAEIKKRLARLEKEVFSKKIEHSLVPSCWEMSITPTDTDNISTNFYMYKME